MMMHNEVRSIGVVGASGYGGVELVRLLQAHPHFTVDVVAGGSSAGAELSEVFPNLDVNVALVASDAPGLQGCDLVFLATPHEVSLELGLQLLDQGQRVVDLSGAFRLSAEAFGDWYGMTHPAPHLAPAVYGLPELFAEGIAQAPLVANPGCYPTAALLALAPLGELVDAASVHIAGLSGTSGAGKGLREELHVTHAGQNVAAYGAPRHRHTPEIEQGWERLTGTPATVTFTPHLLPMARGLLATVTATLLPDVDSAQVQVAAEKLYADQPFVKVLREGSWPSTTYLRGGNGAHLGLAVDPRTNRVTASCAIDNLGKGAAGQAIQNANLMAGLPQDTGLSATGLYP